MKIEDMNETELAIAMRDLARTVNARMNALTMGNPLFVLLVFNEPRAGQYISNCERESTIAVLRETADRLERREETELTQTPQRARRRDR